MRHRQEPGALLLYRRVGLAKGQVLSDAPQGDSDFLQTEACERSYARPAGTAASDAIPVAGTAELEVWSSDMSELLLEIRIAAHDYTPPRITRCRY